ncbi:MAG: aldose 1-epimerase family protein [Clostridiaceae bacterium]|nr:aldose 1-epimerase family protein [Clostridiaceae bacterium]
MDKNVNLDRRDILKYIGDASQLFGVKSYRLIGGKADGVMAVDVKNGAGLEFTVLPSRGLDIAYLSYKGINFSYISKTGIVAPQYFDSTKNEFLRSFFGGFLTTCGLRYAGAPCKDAGEELGLHGRISNEPAEEVYAGTDWIDGTAVMKVKGKVREAKLFAENVVLQREISTYYGENKIYIKDTVENYGFREEPLMTLYHFNLGYPLLSSKSYLLAPTISIVPRDNEAVSGLDNFNRFQLPTVGYKEQVFYHNLKADGQGNTFAALVNPVQQLGVAIWFNKNQLYNLTQWKQMGEGEYVLGIEPCNCHVEGRAKNRKDGTLQFIKPGEIRHFDLEIEVLEDIDRIRELEDFCDTAAMAMSF